MKHYGDITKIKGNQIPVVDCITGGSPCQDLSTAGKRAGLDGARSGLFMEQIRIVKEMREHDKANGRTDNTARPRFMVWENVPGAFSSNGGKDFQAVLSEIVKIAEPSAPDVPIPNGGKWSKSGCLYDAMGKWSIAWRVHDAQFWGVPQRRKRIALVADFGGLAGPEVLFERKGLHGDIEARGGQRESASRGVKNGAGASSLIPCTLKIRGGKEVDSHGKRAGKGALIQTEKSGTLGVSQDQTLFDRSNATLFDAYQHHGWRRGETCGTITAGQNESVRGDTPIIKQPITIEMTSTKNTVIQNGISPTLTARMGPGGNQVNAVFGLHSYSEYKEGFGTLRASGGANGGGSESAVVSAHTVRKLTPMECERLQGFPDGWTDIGEWTDTKGKRHKQADAPRYKALGNSIALPFWFWLLRRISAQYERPATLGSLFDGIGGFPLCWERCNGKGTALWASEIEEFPIAVTKLRFPED